MSHLLENCKQMEQIFASHWKLSDNTLSKMLTVTNLKELYISGEPNEASNNEISPLPLENLLQSNDLIDPVLPNLKIVVFFFFIFFLFFFYFFFFNFF